MYVLIGEGYDVIQHRICTVHWVSIGESFVNEEYEENVALFTTKEKAIDFAESFRLKQCKKLSFSSPQVFRRRSRMGRYVNYRVEEYNAEHLDIDPIK